MAAQSLTKIRRELLAFARTHGQITEAKFCRPYDLLEGGDVKYPVFFFDFTGARKDRQELSMSFTGWVADLLHPEKDNEAEVWSDANMMACDILAFLDDSVERDYVLNDGVTIRPFTETDGDNLAGVSFDFTIRVPFPYNTCVVPEAPNGFFYLITEAGGYIRTEEGERIRLEVSTGQLTTESGIPVSSAAFNVSG